MKRKVRENFSNVEKGKPYTTVVDQVMGTAIKEDEEYQERTKEIFDPIERVKAKPFLGADKQPVPEPPVQPKLTLDEHVGSYRDKLTDLIQDRLVECYSVAPNLMMIVPDNVAKDFLVTRGMELAHPEYECPTSRPYCNTILDMIQNDSLDAEDVVVSLVKWLPEESIEKFMKIYRLDNELTEELLTERAWKVTLHSGKVLRNAIEEEDYDGVVDGIRSCYQEMLHAGVIDEDDYEEYSSRLDIIDLDDEDAEDEINYELNDLYDLCDELGCFVEI